MARSGANFAPERQKSPQAHLASLASLGPHNALALATMARLWAQPSPFRCAKQNAATSAKGSALGPQRRWLAQRGTTRQPDQPKRPRVMAGKAPTKKSGKGKPKAKGKPARLVQVTRPRGNQTVYTEAAAIEICARLETGEGPLKRQCR